MTADVAMTNKGFGEMAITATMAGPVFNLNAGLGLGMTAVFLSNDVDHVEWALFESGKLQNGVLIPIVLIIAVMVS